MSLLLTNATCVTPFRVAENRTVVIEEGQIARIEGGDYAFGSDDEVVDLDGSYVLPGLIDVHAHGAVGVSFMAEEMELEKLVDYFHEHGVTGLLPTMRPAPWPQLSAALERMGGRCHRGPGSELFLGLHSEGPFVNPEVSGGLPAEYFLESTAETWQGLQDAADGTIKMMTVAPEVDGVLEVIRQAYGEGVALSAGHSNASYEEAERAMDEGLSTITHVFNAMEGLHHRRPNVLLAGLLEAELCAQVNAEGVHVDPRMMRMLYRLKGAEGIILTSDLHPAGGLPPGTYTVEGYEVETDGEIMRMPDGTFVGSALALDQGVRTVVNSVGVPLTEAVRMASHNPARELGLEDRKGRIAPGYDADLAVMNGDLEVEMTLVGGRVVYRAEV